METNSFALVLTGTPPPNSYDPLEADYSHNLHASQMLYRSILEVGEDNTLTSGVLQSFRYDCEQTQIRFDLDPKSRFSDGSLMTARDIEITILRMIARRPTFPTLRHINGVKEWIKFPHPLQHKLEGVDVENNTVFIKFDRDVPNPLFRFALPIFGIVKASCVDRIQNTLQENCPSSGIYNVAARDGSSIVFAENEHTAKFHSAPEQITFRYLNQAADPKILSTIDFDNVAVLSQDHNVYTNAIKGEAKFLKLDNPNSRFCAFMLNPQNPAFSDATCRRLFSSTLRSIFAKQNPTLQIESGILNHLLPGYQSADVLNANSPPLSHQQEKLCRTKMRGRSIRWVPGQSNNGVAFELALTKTSNEFGMTVYPSPSIKLNDTYQNFAEGNLDLILGGSGFWDFDPIGDIQMLFTPGLHLPLRFSTEDVELQKMLHNLEFAPDFSKKMGEINQYLYDDSLLNVITHVKRFYLIRGNQVNLNVPVSITPPAAWQLFKLTLNKSPTNDPPPPPKHRAGSV